MGCDIHAHFEIKINGKWEHFSTPRINRNYELFAELANVRGKSKSCPLAKKGLPKDISIVTKICFDNWGEDGHSHSWLDAVGIEKSISFHKHLTDDHLIEHKEWGYLCGNRWGGFLKYPESYSKEIEDIRLVFWFDC